MKIYNNPRTQYEKFVNVFSDKEGYKFSCREKITKMAAEKWKALKKSEDFHRVVEDYIASAPKKLKYKQSTLNFTTIKGKEEISTIANGDEEKEKGGTVLVDDSSSATNMCLTPATIPDILNADESFSSTFDIKRVRSFLDVYCPALQTEDVIQNKAFVTTLSPNTDVLIEFHSLLLSHKSGKQRQRKTILASELLVMERRVEELRNIMTKAVEISLSFSLGTSQLSLLASQKTHLLTEIVACASNVANKLKENGFIRRLRKRQNEVNRLNAIGHVTKSELCVQCRNSTLNWVTAFASFEATGGIYMTKKFHVTTIRHAAEQIESETFVAYEQLNIQGTINQQDFVDCLLNNFPIMQVTRGESSLLINVHELLMNENLLVALLNESDPITETFPEIEHDLPVYGPHKKTGRKATSEKYPQLVLLVSDYIKQHSFSAHGRRRETNGTGTGVTLSQIRKHVLEKIPEMSDISNHTIHRLMVPPMKGTIAAKRYQSLVSARIPRTGRNDYRENHENQHFLFARVAYREEFCSRFSSECTFYSCDDMAKIRMGPCTAVSRYHQEKRFFSCDDMPNLPDHDTPNPGYLICCSGYQQLVLRNRPDNIVNPIYTADELNDVVDGERFVHNEFIDDLHVENEVDRDNNRFFKDKLGRQHYVRYMSGPTKLVLRAVKFSSSNAMLHANDMLPLLQSNVANGIGIAFLKVDNGGDWNLLNLVNELFFCRLWKESKLDVLGIISYAARYSAYNNIEHTWAPMSKKLTSVILPSVLEGDECEPYKQTIPYHDIRQKEVEIFDNAMAMIVDNYWKDVTYNGYAVDSHISPCLSEPTPFNDYKELHDVIMGPLRDLTHNTSLLKELRFMFNHLDKKSNEILFTKCIHPSCTHCVENPIIAVNAWKEIQRVGWPNPVPSKKYHGHFMTYMEVIQEPSSAMIFGDEGLPYSLKVGDCPNCNFVFFSDSEKMKHLKTIHNGKIKRADVEHKCLFIIKENKHARRCNLVFKSTYELRQHKKCVGHVRGRKKDLIAKQVNLDGQRSIVDFAEEDIEGHHCKAGDYDENTCPECQGKYGENSEDWLLCKNCKNWFHENCF